ncbi:uncharacterized protein MKK02DRAFT_41664 [Dioszegia hungarica]|uniref:RNase H type-1 domain-containing protein n=1 Tax=Dioszegia hungarica TaxID=4972 RepID=A0AA38LPH3_9TREE|nr:uncharacterized protein MKK02DRAFT_41664 [Dioszegia hungarica]KAI9632022.1 hypothetical protein MKK02DRAFT_41664 [Dioszegia hungarica]
MAGFLGGLFTQLRTSLAARLLPEGYSLVPVPVPRLPPLPPRDPTRTQHEIRTKTSGPLGGSFTTFSGVLNERSDGGAQAAFSITLHHHDKPLRLGRARDAVMIWPGQCHLIDAYVNWLALGLWREELSGGDVTLLSSSATAVDLLSADDPRKGDRTVRAIAKSIQWAGARYDIHTQLAYLPASVNLLARRLSRVEAPEKRLKMLGPELRDQLDLSDRRFLKWGILQKLPATSLLPSKFVVIPLRLQSAAARPKHEIYTDISNKGTGTTTIAGVLNPSGDGRAQDAFSFTLNHTSIPLQFGSASFLVRPGNTAAMEAYAMVFALALWRNKLRGGDVTCMSDCRAVVDSAEKRVLPAGPVKLPVTDVELNRAAFAAVGPAMRELAEDADLNLEFRWITGDRNKLADVLSKCTTQGRRDRLHPEVLQQVEATGKRLSEIKLEGLVGVLGVMLPGAVAKAPVKTAVPAQGSPDIGVPRPGSEDVEEPVVPALMGTEEYSVRGEDRHDMGAVGGGSIMPTLMLATQATSELDLLDVPIEQDVENLRADIDLASTTNLIQTSAPLDSQEEVICPSISRLSDHAGEAEEPFIALDIEIPAIPVHEDHHDAPVSSTLRDTSPSVVEGKGRQKGARCMIRTSIVNNGPYTTFAGVHNPRRRGLNSLSFSYIIKHDTLPMKIGSTSMIIPPGKPALAQAYALVLALVHWRKKLSGKKVVWCSGDRNAVILVQRHLQQPHSTHIGDGTSCGVAIGTAISQLAAEYGIVLEPTHDRIMKGTLAAQLDAARTDLARAPSRGKAKGPNISVRKRLKNSDERLSKLVSVGLAMESSAAEARA